MLGVKSVNGKKRLLIGEMKNRLCNCGGSGGGLWVVLA